MAARAGTAGRAGGAVPAARCVRGRSFSIAQTPLLGDEGQLFLRMYAGLIQERDTLLRLAEE